MKQFIKSVKRLLRMLIKGRNAVLVEEALILEKGRFRVVRLKRRRDRREHSKFQRNYVKRKRRCKRRMENKL